MNNNKEEFNHDNEIKQNEYVYSNSENGKNKYESNNNSQRIDDITDNNN